MRPPGVRSFWAWVVGALLVAGVSRLPAQQLAFTSFTADDGLAESIVLSLLQDRRGYLWVGTPFGVSRFDGVVFERFGIADGLPSDVVRALLETADGRIWIGTDGGLAVWDGTAMTVVDGVPSSGVRCLAERDGVVYAGTHRRGVARVEGGRVTVLTTADGLASDSVRAAVRGRDGWIWFGTEGGVTRLDRDDALHAGPQDGLGNVFVRTLFERADGTMVVGTDAGAYRAVGDRFERLAAASLGETPVTAAVEDGQGRLWLGTRERGVCRELDPGFECIGRRRGLGEDSVTALLEDREGNLWVGTYGGGVDRLATESILNFDAGGGSVQAILQAEGRTWFGTHGGGVVSQSEEGLVTLSTAEGLPDDKVSALARARVGGFWVGTMDGAVRVEKGEVREDVPALRSQLVFDLYEDGDGTLWAGTLNRLVAISGIDVRSYGPDEGLPDGRVNAIEPRRAGGLWLATGLGLAVFDEGGFRVFRREDGLADDHLHDLVETESGVLWVATSNGLSRFADGRFESFYSSDGLSHDKCLALLQDDLGRLWVGTSRGINVFDGERFRAFTRSDGLASAEVSSGAAYRDDSGLLWFGTARGASAFVPGAVVGESTSPLVHLTSVQVGDEVRTTGSALVLGPHENDVRFEFVGISLTYPTEVRYEYQLVGVDRRWHFTQARTVAYSGLSPGRYDFVVRASRIGGEWSVPVHLGLDIAPPFWQTTWFRLGAMTLLVGVALGLHGLRLGSLHRRQRVLESLVGERTEALRQERQELALRKRQLETTNMIVQQINAEVEFDRLLAAMLDGLSFLEAGTSGVAYVIERSTGLFRRRAIEDWPGEAPLSVPAADLEAALWTHGRSIAPGVSVTPATEIGEGVLGPLPPAMLVVTIEIEDRRVGWLVVGHRSDPRAFDQADAMAVSDVRTHITSAFLKGRMMNELRRLDEKKNEFLGIAAHDLRSPLGGVKGWTEFLIQRLEEGRFDPDRWRRFLGYIRSSTDQMQTLVGDLLDVAAIETGRVSLELRSHSLADLVGDRLPIHEPPARDKGIELSCDLVGDDVSVLADATRFGEILDNLVSNAVKYTPPGGSITVRGRPFGSEVRIDVVDTGLGLRREELAEVFTGRKLSARPTAGESSTGLGLVIAKKLVELQGGRIWVESEVRRGSTFSFVLPSGSTARGASET